MKARIGPDGNLLIVRAGVEKQTFCPYSEEAHCGDWCPLFGEPTKGMTDDDTSIHISLCNTIIVFDELVDDRKGGCV